MSAIRLRGATSGTTDVVAAAIAGDGVLTLPSGTGTLALDSAVGKVLQVVRATDATDRLTTSTSFVDASISVTITPQRSTSAILIIWTSNPYIDNLYGILRITDSSNNAIPGAQVCAFGPAQVQIISTMIGYDLPGSISAKTYKGRFRVSGTATLTIQNSAATGQLFAIEVAA